MLSYFISVHLEICLKDKDAARDLYSKDQSPSRVQDSTPPIHPDDEPSSGL